ncbi:MAG: NifU family protein [Dehalococcoidia bacterium]
MDAGVQLVLANIRAILEGDGGDIELVAVEEGVARVRYRMGANEECPECVMEPDTLRQFLQEAFAAQAPQIRDVEVEVAQQGG